MDTSTHRDPDLALAESEPIRRGSTGIRILLTLLFAVVWGVVETALAVLVIFSLAWALLAGEAPPQRVRDLSNRLVAYAYRLWRYMTYAEADVPFPFSEFPEAVEDTFELGDDEAPEVRRLLDRARQREDVEDDFNDPGMR